MALLDTSFFLFVNFTAIILQETLQAHSSAFSNTTYQVSSRDIGVPYIQLNSDSIYL